MAVFYNRATLNYNGLLINSNVTEGEIVQTLSAAKTAVTDTYSSGGDVTYVISLVNSGTADHTGLTITDDLGAYSVSGEPDDTLTPLTYKVGSAKLFIDGQLQAEPAAEAGPPLVFSGIDVPAGASAVLIYEADVNGFAPLALDSGITNTAVISGGSLSDEITVFATVTAAAEPDLSIIKALSPETVSENGQVTYTFTIYNYGNTEASDGLIMTDTFTPALSGITVEINGQAAPASAYTYDEATGEFATAEGALTVPAATFSQDVTTRSWAAEPGTLVISITGTI